MGGEWIQVVEFHHNIFWSAPGGIRTLNLSVRSASLYPLSYRGV